MNNDLTNVTEELVEQLKDGTAEVVEVKGGSLKSKLITGGIALGATAGAGILGFVLGAKHERKKWESFNDDDDDFDDIDNLDEQDYVEYVETEPETSTEQPKEADKAEK